MVLRFGVVCLVSLAACGVVRGSGEPEGGDAGDPVDVDGGQQVDAGLVEDAGFLPMDAGAADAGGMDAGDVGGRDAGLDPSDGGLPEACSTVAVTALCPRTGWCWRNPAPFAVQLDDVVAFGCEAWAVGAAGAIVTRTPTGWQAVPSGTREGLHGIAGSARDDLWAVGDNATIVHFDGARWQVELSNTLPASFRGAYVPERGVLFIAATDGIHRFENGLLTTVYAPPNVSFSHLTGLGRSFMRAVGEETIPNVDRRAVSVRFDGVSWATESSRSMIRFNRVAIAGSRWFAAGSMNAHGPDYGHVAQLAPVGNGVPFTQAAREFSGLAAISSTSVLVVGQRFSASIFSFDGTTFTPIAASPQDNPKGVAFGGREAFVVGQTLGRVVNGAYVAESAGWRGTVNGLLVLPNDEVWLNGGLRSRNGGPFVETIAANRFADLGPVVGESATELWAAGSGGIWHFDGTSWALDTTGPTTRMNGVRARGGDVWAWKWNEVWARFAGGAWQKLSLGTMMTIDDVWPVGNQLANVIGRDGATSMLWVGNGTRFSAQPVPTLAQSDTFRLVRGEWLAPWLLTGNGELHRYDGSQWHLVSLPQGFWVNELLTARGKVLVAGAEGAVLEWNGTQLVPIGLEVPVSVNALEVDATGAIWAGGSGGTVVVRR